MHHKLIVCLICHHPLHPSDGSSKRDVFQLLATWDLVKETPLVLVLQSVSIV